jgi:hypothetical protein
MKFITLRVLCEGPTESNFIIQVLGPHLKVRNVFARPEPLRSGKYGIVSYDRLRKAIQADIGRSRNHEHVTTMIDLYKIGKYPGAGNVQGESVIDRVRRIEAGMAANLPNDRFIPYVQLHEFEALVLVDLDRLSEQFPDGEADGAAERLRSSIGSLTPEEVDDGEETAPSKRIIQEVPAYSGLKPIAGPAIALAIGLPNLRKACPHFNEWVSRLENLQTDG